MIPHLPFKIVKKKLNLDFYCFEVVIDEFLRICDFGGEFIVNQVPCVEEIRKITH